jgi:kumamolisin
VTDIPAVPSDQMQPLPGSTPVAHPPATEFHGVMPATGMVDGLIHVTDAAYAMEVENYLTSAGMTIDNWNAAAKLLRFSGTAEKVNAAFAVELTAHTSAGVDYHSHVGPVNLPAALVGKVDAVLGLDSRPVARPHFRKRGPAGAHTGASPLWPVDVAKLYGITKTTTPKVVRVGVVELGGGSYPNDLITAARFQSIPPASYTAVATGGVGDTPGSDADGEVALDLQVIQGIISARGHTCKLVGYYAPNTDAGYVGMFADISAAGEVDAVGDSWGGPEIYGTPQSQQQMDNVLKLNQTNGIQVCVASGDSGSSDGTNQNCVDDPACSPYALACGGTLLEGMGSTILSETVWGPTNGATGGGVSKSRALPSYQQGVANIITSGRNVPDVAGNADPSSGWNTYVDGQEQPIGGTSAAAPMWAAICAIVKVETGKVLTPAMVYSLPSDCFNDVTAGSNGAYSAKPGYDQCTGRGSPRVDKILAYLTGTVPVPPVPPIPPTPPVPPIPPVSSNPTEQLVQGAVDAVFIRLEQIFRFWPRGEQVIVAAKAAADQKIQQLYGGTLPSTGN